MHEVCGAGRVVLGEHAVVAAEEHPSVSHGGDASVAGGDGPGMPAEPDARHPRPARRRVAGLARQDRRGAIGAAVVHDDDLGQRVTGLGE